MNNPKVSIVMPVYNVADKIADCVKSILSQTYRNIELIVVDDCTPDNSIEVLQSVFSSYVQSDIQMRVIRHKSNKRQSGARNTGVKAATGEYLMFVDSDDEILPDCVEKLIFCCLSNGVDVATANSLMINPKTKEEYYKPNTYKQKKVYVGRQIIEEFSNFECTLWNNMFKLDSFKNGELEQVEGMFYEDELWRFHFLVSLREDTKIGVITDVTYIYKCWPGSTLQSYTLFHLFSTIKKELYAYQYALNAPNWLKSFAAREHNRMKLATYLSTIEKCKGLKLFYTQYKNTRTRRIVSKKEYWFKVAHTKMEKLMALHDFLPISLGAVLTYICSCLLIYRLNKTYHNLKTPKIGIDDQMMLDYYNLFK